MDGIASWTWSGCESKPVQVEVYAPGDTAAQLLNGVKVAEGKLEGYRTTLTVDYTPGELTAVALANALSRDRAVVNSVILPHFLITRSFGFTIDHYLDNQSYHRRRRATSAIALSEQNSHESETIKVLFVMTNQRWKNAVIFPLPPHPPKKSLASLASCPFSEAASIEK